MSDERDSDDVYWKNEINQTTGKRKKYVSYRPTRTQLISLLSNHPDRLYLDEDGRIYGIIRDQENPIYNDLLQKGIVTQDSDGDGDQLMFVWLPGSLKGDFSSEKKRRNRGFAGLLPDEVLEMPQASQVIYLYSYTDFDAGPIIEMEIIEYCEKNTRSTKISLIRSSLREL
jgi:hypothetical protein